MSSRHQLLVLNDTAAALRSRYLALEGHGQRAQRAIDDEHAAAVADVCGVYLRSLDDGELARAAQLTGFRGFDRRDPRKAREHERHVLQQALAQIRADPRYQERERKAGPTGELTELLATARRELAPFEEACLGYEGLPDFLELIATGYDTPEFSVGWWRADYWRLWAAGDRICRALGVEDFGDDVLPAYRKIAEPRDYWRGEAQRLDAEIGAIHELVRRHDEAMARLGDLDSIYLEQSRAYLAEHVIACDLGLLAQWAELDPAGQTAAILAGLRRIAGVRAKRTYVDEIVHSGIAPIVGNLDERMTKYERKLTKLARGKHLAPRDVQDTLGAKAPGLTAQADKTEKRIDQLVAARNYDDFALDQDHHLWWLHLVGSPPPRLAPSLRGWYDQHPEHLRRAEPEPARDAAPAEAFMAHRDDAERSGGYLS